MKKLIITLFFLMLGALYIVVLSLFDYDILQAVASMLLGGMLTLAIHINLMRWK